MRYGSETHQPAPHSRGEAAILAGIATASALELSGPHHARDAPSVIDLKRHRHVAPLRSFHASRRRNLLGGTTGRITVTTPALSAPVLSDVLIPRVSATALRFAREVALIGGAVALLWAAGNVVIPLPFTPVPLSLATFSVLLIGAGLGPLRAFAATGAYLALGLVGLPMFAEGGFGWAFASFGYVLGYIVAAVLVGHLARRRADRSVLPMALAAIASTTAVYALGVPWLAGFLGVGLVEALAIGVVPFLIGDAIKAVAAAALLPATWKLVEKTRLDG